MTKPNWFGFALLNFAAIILVYPYESSNTDPMSQHTDEIGDQITTLGNKCMDYLIENPEQLSHFMTHAGITPDALRSGFGSREMALGAMDYFIHNESALLAMCANAGISAATFMSAWQRLNPEI